MSNIDQTMIAGHASAARAAWIVFALLVRLTGTVQSQSLPPQWSLAEAPDVWIGDGGSSVEEFDRIIGAVRLSTGEILIGDGATQELRVFSSSGEHVRTLSRRGAGPGELRNLGPFSVVGDTLFVIERPPGPSQLHLFSVTEGFVRRIDLRATGSGGVTGLSRLANGAVLVMSGGFRAVTPPPPGAITRDSMKLGLLFSGASVTWLGTFAGNTWLGYALPPGSAVPGSMTRFSFGPGIVLAGGADRVWIGDSGSGRIQVFDGTGQRLRSVTLQHSRRALSRDALERWRRWMLASARDPMMAARVRAEYERAADVRAVPAFSAFHAGPDDELWIEGFRESELEPAPVFVFDRHGKSIGRFELPSRTRLLWVGTGRVIVLHLDEDGVESVGLHAVRRAGPS